VWVRLYITNNENVSKTCASLRYLTCPYLSVRPYLSVPHHVPLEGGDVALDVPLKEMETLTKAAIAPSPLDHLVKDIPAHLALSPNGERVMQYE
jgi:hypothetical protein